MTATEGKKEKRSVSGLAALDEILGEMGKLEEFQAKAIEEVPAWRIEQAKKQAPTSLRERLTGGIA